MKTIILHSLHPNNYLEFIIKSYPVEDYPSHSGITEKMIELEHEDQFILKEPFGSIKYKGKGLFLAGGTGITPFYALLKDLYFSDNIYDSIEGNRLIFSNSTHNDLFLEDELKDILGKKNVVFTLTKEEHTNYRYGKIDKDMIVKNNEDIDYYYVCGPASFQEDIIQNLKDIGIGNEKIIIESW